MVLLLLVILGYVGYQILHLLNPPNTYETVLTATVEDKVEAEGVVLFQETLIPGSGDLGYLAEDGARVSAGTVVAEVYTSSGQSALRAALDSLNEQIGLLQRAENVSTTQVDTMIQERTTALYDLLDAVDRGDPAALDAGREDYLLAQNKILVVTGEDAGFASRIAALQAEAAQLQSQLGAPAQIAAPLTGYFVRSASTRQLTQPAGDILAMDAASLKAALDAGLDAPLTGCAGKMVSGFSWSYCGVCTAEEAQKLLQADGTPLDQKVQIRFPGQTDQALPAQLTEVTIDEGAGLARFVLTCDSVTGEVLRLGQAEAEVIVSRTTGLRVPAAAVHYVLETPEASSGGGQLPAQWRAAPPQGRTTSPASTSNSATWPTSAASTRWTATTPWSPTAPTSSSRPRAPTARSARCACTTRSSWKDKISTTANFCPSSY